MMCYPAYGHNEVFSLLAPKGPRACLQMQSWLQEKLSKVGEDELSLPPPQLCKAPITALTCAEGQMDTG